MTDTIVHRSRLLVLAVLAITVALANAGQAMAQAPANKKFAGKKPGQEWSGNGLKMKFCWCPHGKFVMGSPDYEQGRSRAEEQEFVTISLGFWMGKFEVTQDEWQRVMKKSPSPSRFEGKMLPVETISWVEASEFCKALTKQERGSGNLPAGWEYRLPTEAQWEYACRAGTSLTFNFGADSKELGDHAWIKSNTKNQTHEVGQRKGNRWGLYDMHGNVWEWCRDWYKIELPGGKNPEVTTKTAYPYRVIRGGAWNRAAGFCRSAYRGWMGPDKWLNNLGFRVAAVQRAASKPSSE